MKEIEELLKSQRVASTSDEFDTRMNGLFEKPPARRRFLFRRSVALWQAAAASLLMGGFGFWLGHTPVHPLPEERAPESVTTMYIIETHSNRVRNIFDTVPAIEPFYKPPSPPISVVLTISEDGINEERSI